MIEYVKEEVVYGKYGMLEHLPFLFDTSLNGLDLDSRSQDCEKAKTSATVMSQNSHSG